MNVITLYFWFLTMLAGWGDFFRFAAGSFHCIVRGFVEGAAARENICEKDFLFRLTFACTSLLAIGCGV